MLGFWNGAEAMVTLLAVALFTP
eukprot:SAG31_NODE_46269_length_255_cov_0.660256_1_plen_22_part_10